MHAFLRDKSHFIATLQARQTGKTFNGMAKLLHIALTNPESTIIVTAPKHDQVKRIAFKHLQTHLLRLKTKNPALYRKLVPTRGIQRTIIRLKNSSTILAESPIPETIRGHTAKAVYLMEANFIRDDMDLYTAVLFTLNTTNGTLIAESTPWNTDSLFHHIYHHPDYHQFSTHRIPYQQALPPNGPLTEKILDMIKAQLQGDPDRWTREMLCEWTENTDRWLPIALINLCQDPDTTYQKPGTKHRGNYYAGIDFGKHRDHTVIAVIERIETQLHLRHLKTFPLDTPYGTAIAYTRRLQKNWTQIHVYNCDQTGIGDPIIEDMTRSGITNTQGTVFTQSTKQNLATRLRATMQTATCPHCGWHGQITTHPHWNTTCPKGCTTPQNNPQQLTPQLHLPYDPDLYAELNTVTHELTPGGKIYYNHPEATHDDKFWALALAVTAATTPTPNKPIAYP